MLSYNSSRKNFKLTDFNDTKVMVLSNSVKNVPVAKKSSEKSENGVLQDFF